MEGVLSGLSALESRQQPEWEGGMQLSEKLKSVASALAVMGLVFLYVVMTQKDTPSPEFESKPTARNSANTKPRPETRISSAGNKYLAEFEFPANPRVPNLKWTASVEIAKEQSQKSGKRIFLAIESLNSVYAAQNRVLFAKDDEVQQSLKNYVLLALFIDSLPTLVLKEQTTLEWREQEIDSNRILWRETIENPMVPNYAIVEPAEMGMLKLIESYDKGYLINDPEDFVRFLKTNERSKD